MKSRLIEPEEKKSEIKFPCLARSIYQYDELKSSKPEEIVIAGPVIGTVGSGKILITPKDVKVELENAGISPNTFVSDPVDVELIPRNGVVVFRAGTELNMDMDGDGIFDSIRTVVSYKYHVPNHQLIVPNHQLIVLFTSSRSGTVVQSKENSEYDIGHYSPLWVDITENGWWEILPPGTKIELEQE